MVYYVGFSIEPMLRLQSSLTTEVCGGVFICRESYFAVIETFQGCNFCAVGVCIAFSQKQRSGDVWTL